jgi:hypothetical protein
MISQAFIEIRRFHYVIHHWWLAFVIVELLCKYTHSCVCWTYVILGL